MRLYGRYGQCARCGEQIAPMDYVLTARSEMVYHLECFACVECNERQALDLSTSVLITTLSGNKF